MSKDNIHGLAETPGENKPNPPAVPGTTPVFPHAPPPPGADSPGATPPLGGPPTGISLPDWQQTPETVKAWIEARRAKVAALLREL